jgi:hypothetical protein
MRSETRQNSVIIMSFLLGFTLQHHVPTNLCHSSLAVVHREGVEDCLEKASNSIYVGQWAREWRRMMTGQKQGKQLTRRTMCGTEDLFEVAANRLVLFYLSALSDIYQSTIWPSERTYKRNSRFLTELQVISLISRWHRNASLNSKRESFSAHGVTLSLDYVRWFYTLVAGEFQSPGSRRVANDFAVRLHSAGLLIG